MPVSVPEEISSFSKFVGKTPCWSTFIVELQPANSFKVKITRSTLSKKRRLHSYTETLTQVLSVHFSKNV